MMRPDLAFIIGHFEDCIEKSALGAFDLQQFPDHGPRNFPGAVGVPQFLAFGIGDQFVTDTCVKKITWHAWKSASVEAPLGNRPHLNLLIRLLV